MRIVPRITLRKLLLERDYAERSCQVIGRTGSEEKLVGRAIVCRSSTKFNSPKLVDENRFAVGVLDGAHELSRYAVEGVDSAGVGVVRDQQRVAQWSKIPGGDGEAPGLVQRRAMCHLLQECSIFAEDVDVAPRRSGRTRERYVDQPSEVLGAEGSEPRRERLVRKRLDQLEFAVINVNFVVHLVGREKKIPGGPAGDGQAGVHRPSRSHRNDGIVGVGLRRPSADGPVLGRKKEDRRPSLHLELIRTVV